MSFNVQKLVNNRALVTGTDIAGNTGSEVLDTTQWDEVNENTRFKTDLETFEATVEEFFAPISEALEALNRPAKVEDSVSYIVLDEGTEGVVAQPRQVVKLKRASIVLRLIEAGNTDRLVWVGDKLEILELDTPLPGVVVDDSETVASE